MNKKVSSKETKNVEKNKGSEFEDRKFEEVDGGYYDDYGFYYTPDGSKLYFLHKKVFGMRKGTILIEMVMINMVNNIVNNLRWIL